jgi:HAD superfamily hydrolase (TIGR01484 family)
MQPIATLPTDEARRLSGLLFDLDDTLLDHGRLPEAAYAALFRLREAGLELLCVTGRPAGWGEMLARQWPIGGAVTENGAFAIVRDGTRVHTIDSVEPAERRSRTEALQAIVGDLRRAFPELEPASDVRARVTDFTFDIGEDRKVPKDTVAQIVAAARVRGVRTTVSSVHMHVSLDGDDKASGAVRVLGTLFGEDPTRALGRWAFIGDSENDQACFAAFRTTIGVANLSGRPSLAPRYITAAPRSTGFVEAAQTLISRRGSGSS